MADDVLKSFALALGFKMDSGAQAKFEGAITSAVTKANLAALALAETVKAVEKFTASFVASFDQLYYASGRTGATVENIKALRYAFTQVGGSAESASAAIEAFAKAQRTNPGVKQYIKNLGIKETGDAVIDLIASVDKIREKNPYAEGALIANLLGISEEQFLLFDKNAETIKKKMAELNALRKTFGVDSQKSAKMSAEFTAAMGKLSAVVEVAGDKLLSILLPGLQKVADGVTNWLNAHPETVAFVFRQISEAADLVAKGFDFLMKGGTALFTFLSDRAAALNQDGSFLRTWEKIVSVFERVETAIRSVLKWLGELDRATDMSGGLNTIKRLLGWVEGKTTGFVEGGVAAAGAIDGATRTSVGVPDEKPAPGIIGRATNALRRAVGLTGSGTQARPPEASGKYRPVYKLSDADLSQRTVDIIAGEAIRRNPESIDAVINNMLNRVGSKKWGPSGNLLEVATAPNQYEAAWKGSKANASETEMIRARIRAIASGGVPDNTNGSNSYRAASYAGPWARKHAIDGRVVGGNRYAFEAGFPNGPYAPYATPRPDGQPTAPAYAAPKGFNPGSFDVNRLGAFPMGSNTVNNGGHNITMSPQTTIKIDGATDPASTGAAVERAQGRANDLSLRNVQAAIR